MTGKMNKANETSKGVLQGGTHSLEPGPSSTDALHELGEAFAHAYIEHKAAGLAAFMIGVPIDQARQVGESLLEVPWISERIGELRAELLAELEQRSIQHLRDLKRRAYFPIHKIVGIRNTADGPKVWCDLSHSSAEEIGDLRKLKVTIPRSGSGQEPLYWIVGPDKIQACGEILKGFRIARRFSA
ncbi:hypothetical protein OE699_02210 [Sedimentimonas flavescens]|uniref:Uncharacterized protein n=1 Tax=Sedimentimonas flavescens TaxID=2851012 RepID=A0ABT2ZV76_9RHOB|nr:hypothetical protein [Sedimentimonas flavescens]MCV2877653.1 hypothetical protein [Sedimentimonas flavescens]